MLHHQASPLILVARHPLPPLQSPCLLPMTDLFRCARRQPRNSMRDLVLEDLRLQPPFLVVLSWLATGWQANRSGSPVGHLLVRMSLGRRILPRGLGGRPSAV